MFWGLSPWQGRAQGVAKIARATERLPSLGQSAVMADSFRVPSHNEGQDTR